MRIKKTYLVWVVAIAGSALSFTFFSTYRSWEKSFVQMEFNGVGQQNFYAIRQTLQNHFLILKSMQAFYESSTHVDRGEFQTFTKKFIGEYQTIQALEWIPLVRHDQRDAFEARHQKKVPDFQIREETVKGDMVRRRPADTYYPVTYVEPLMGNEAVLGFDLGSNPIRSFALSESRTTDKMLATSRIILIRAEAESVGFLLILPVYHDPGTKKEFQGFIVGVFRIGDMVEASIRQFQSGTNHSEIQLVDATSPALPALLYESDNFTDNRKYRFEQNFEVAGRQWKLIMVPTPAFVNEHVSHMDVIGLTTGLIFTLLVSGYLKNITSQSDEIKRQVRERTEELKRHKENLEKLIDTIEDGIVVINDKGIIQKFNPTAEKIFQYRSDEVIGKNVNMLMPEPYHSNHDDYIKNYITTGVSKLIGIGRDVEGKKKDGTVFPIHLAMSEMMVENKSNFVGSIKDITQQKEAEEKLVLAKETAEQANRIKSEFMNTMSHELRTPLTIILGNIEELTDEQDLPDTDEIAEIARDCSKAGDMLMQLINDILDISKIEAGKMPLNREKVDSAELINDVAKTIRVLAENKGLDLIIKGKDRVIDIDPIRIKQTLFNLLSNSIKFTDSGAVSITTEVEKDWFAIRVSDTGCGMDEKSLTYIFDPFRQVDSSTTRKVGGTGLGLAITKKLVELHGGAISVESKVGKGSSFTIKLPIEADYENTPG